jgi:hypothetical protein
MEQSLDIDGVHMANSSHTAELSCTSLLTYVLGGKVLRNVLILPSVLWVLRIPFNVSVAQLIPL